MKILVLGACGIQGRAAVYDLARNPEVTQVICADARIDNLGPIADLIDPSKLNFHTIDANDINSIAAVMALADVAVDLLPFQFLNTVCQAALQTATSVVNTNYGKTLQGFDQAAKDAGIIIMPECGMDPGIDLVLFGGALRRFDRLEVLNSYAGGVPDPKAIDNPLKYKISWNWDMVLTSTKRPSRMIHNQQVVDIAPQHQHDEQFISHIDFPGLGPMEGIPNGDAIVFTDILGVTDTIIETGRYALRWPGWSAFWRPLKALNFLSDDPVPGLPGNITPHQFMSKHLEPQLHYGDKEKDLVAMYNIFEGIIDGKRKRLTNRLIIERDLHSDLLGMSQGVGYPAAIAATMIARGDINSSGILSPVTDIPYEHFMAELAERGIKVEDTEVFIEP